ncbi:MAG: AAA family ATPase [Bdellovibrionota bacterium]
MKIRYLSEQILKDLKSKMVFLGGPRQVGKTTLSLDLFSEQSYLNWDSSVDREKILKYELPSQKTWIFDEIHKYKKWRNYLKGLYDKNKKQQILVTGSARLDLYRYGGDSLQGRYHFLRLHPFTFDELKSAFFSDFETLFELSGFPEPFLKGDKIEATRWSKEYRSRILRDDISSVESIHDLGTAELVLMRLPELVGSPLSINSISEDVQTSFKTIKKWLDIYERFYAIYRLSPFGSPKIKAVKKEQKHYHYDWTLVKESGYRFENMIGSHLLKRVHFLEDTQGREIELRYFKDNEQREVDFVVVEDKKPILFIECKYNDTTISPHLKYLKKKFPHVESYQLTYNSKKDFVSQDKIRVCDAFRVLPEILSQL